MNSILECYLCSAMEIDFDDDIFSVPVILESHNTPMLDCILRVFLSKIRPLNLNVPGKHTITIDSSEFDQISPKDVFFKTLNIDIEILKPGAPLSYESYYDNETSTKEVFNIYMRDYIDDPRKGYTLAKYFSHEIRHAYDDYIVTLCYAKGVASSCFIVRLSHCANIRATSSSNSTRLNSDLPSPM